VKDVYEENKGDFWIMIVGLRHNLVSILGIMYLLNGHEVLKGILAISGYEREGKNGSFNSEGC